MSTSDQIDRETPLITLMSLFMILHVHVVSRYNLAPFFNY